jgi:hypothetical protein
MVSQKRSLVRNPHGNFLEISFDLGSVNGTWPIAVNTSQSIFHMQSTLTSEMPWSSVYRRIENENGTSVGVFSFEGHPVGDAGKWRVLLGHGS